MPQLNTFKVCKPIGTEKFNYHMPIYYTMRGIEYYIDTFECLHVPLHSDMPMFGNYPQMKFNGVTINYVIDFYIDFTDYTLYNTKKLTFHHLN